MYKVVVLFNRLGPYHYARLDALNNLCSLTIVQTVAVDQTYKWDKVKGTGGYPVITLYENEKEMQASGDWYRRLQGRLESIRPDVVMIPGWYSDISLFALKWSITRGCPKVLMSESTQIDFQRSRIKEAVKSMIVGRFDAAFVGGEPQRQYIVRLGMEEDRVFLGYNAVDNDYFEHGAREIHQNRQLVLDSLGLENPFFLSSCRFIEKKNLLRLLCSYKGYRDRNPGKAWELVLLGDGELLPTLQKKIVELGLCESVKLPGFIQYEELPLYYGTASCFILASTSEQWGLVVNEAMASGLPVLVSERCGCAEDLVQHGENGFVFDPYNINQMTKCMLDISENDELRARYALRSRKIIGQWGTGRFAENSVAACKCAIEKHRKSAKPYLSTLFIDVVRSFQ